MIKVSILVAVYNSEKYLKKCLDSLINQTLKEIEIICINDGSTDNSLEILNDYLKRDERIRILSQKNKGASASRNLGIKYCNGKFICMVDSDDFIEEKCLEKAYKYAIDNDLDASIFKLFLYADKKIEEFKNIYQNKILSGKEALKLSLDWNIPGVGLYKDNIIKKIKYDEGNINGDELSTRKFLFYSRRVGFTAGKYYYRNNPESITRKFSLKQFDILKNKILIKDFLIENKIYEEVKNEFERSNLKLTLSKLNLLYKNRLLINIVERKKIEQDIKIFHSKLDFESIKIGLKNEKKQYLIFIFKSFDISFKIIKIRNYYKEITGEKNVWKTIKRIFIN